MITKKELEDMFLYVPSYGEFVSKISTGTIMIGDVVGHKTSEGYLSVRIKGKDYYIHRLVWLYHYGYFPEFIDHIDRNRTNNKLSNLRDCTRVENQQNLSLSVKNKTGYQNIFVNQNGSYSVQKTIKGIRMSSSHRTLEEAIASKESMINGTFTGTRGEHKTRYVRKK